VLTGKITGSVMDSCILNILITYPSSGYAKIPTHQNFVSFFVMIIAFIINFGEIM